MQDLGERTFQFALGVVRLVAGLPSNKVTRVICPQLLRSGTSVGANWEEATGASSQADFVYRVEICERESRESNYWLRLLEASGFARGPEVVALKEESKQLVAIFTSIGRKGKRKGEKGKADGGT